jgi:hypothetical protein
MGHRQHSHPEVTVALQGTLDTFALPDVLRLLAATRKTGRLRLSGSRGNGAVWVEAGSVVCVEAAHAPHATEADAALFELLRFEDGAFTFDVDLVHEDPAPALDVEEVLGAAEKQLAEWQEIESVVPSLDAWVSLRSDLPGPEVVIDRDRWATLVAIGAGATVRRVGDELCLSELAVSRALKALVELGVAEVDDAPPPGAGTSSSAPTAVPSAFADAASPPPPPPPPAHLGSPVDEVASRSAPSAALRLDELEHDDQATAPTAGAGLAGLEDLAASDPDLGRQLSNLSPRAAEAVRAATTATSEDERVAALADAEAAVAEEDDSLNRGLLLKFLSSVKS